MIQEIQQHLKEVEAFAPTSIEEVEAFRIKYLSKKGILNGFFKAFKEVPGDQKREYGQAVNTLKTKLEETVKHWKETLESQEEEAGSVGDLTRPGNPITIGSRHPISIVRNSMVDILSTIGSTIAEGQELGDDREHLS